MRLGRVLMRSLIGVGAWLLGAAAATVGSLLAVSLIGQGIVASPSQQLTVATVNRALATKPIRTAPAARVPARHPPGAGTRRPTGSPSTRSAPSPSSSLPNPRSTGGTVLTSLGGTVVANCESAGAYLVSWSPKQGYQASGVVQGPASAARVTFGSYPDDDSNPQSVTMTVFCHSGVPVAATNVHHVDE